jgi:ketosteroid isomerase-like protein
MEDAEQVVREIWSRWNGGERSANPELIDPEIEIHSDLTRGVFQGTDGLRRWSAEIDEQFDDWNLEIGEVQTLEDGRLLVTGSIHGRGRQSHIDLDEVVAWLVEMRDGRMLRLYTFIGPDGPQRAESEISP